MLVWGCFGCNKRPTSKRKRASFYNVNCICFVCFSDGLVLDNFLPKIRKSTSESRANQKKSHIAVEIYWRKNGETKGDTKATGPIGNENTKLLVVIVQKVIDPLNVIFETSFRKDEPGQDEQNLKQNSFLCYLVLWHHILHFNSLLFFRLFGRRSTSGMILSGRSIWSLGFAKTQVKFVFFRNCCQFFSDH